MKLVPVQLLTVLLFLMLSGCSFGRVPITADKSVWYMMVGAKVKTDVITADAIPDVPALVSIGGGLLSGAAAD